MTLLRLQRLALVLPLTLSLGACAAETDDGDVGDDENVGTSAEALTSACARSRAEMLASASGVRRHMLERGFTWWDAQVSYSQSRWYKGYRTDCSGFVSMCWETGESYTTADFIVGGGESDRLATYDELLPGDALVRRSDGAGHVFLFLGWNDRARSSMCVLEQASTALDMEYRSRGTSALKAQGYRAIRSERL
jgi:hypothetical protein